ncbi:hypothetical protein BJ165DRAFT_1404770 [Panaeolus papilionaceus]|nr:hypothetical protein BJ165DRAFT_1404770 [Panaeolus papilionaceus]
MFLCSPYTGVIVENSSPQLHYDGNWCSTAPTVDMLDPAIYFPYQFSEQLYTVPQGQKGSIRYNFTATESSKAYCNISPPAPGNDDTSANLLSGREQSHAYPLCTYLDLSPSTSYTLNLTLEVNAGQVWFDRLSLLPSPDAALDNTLLRLNHQNPVIHYDEAWNSWGSPERSFPTNKTGSTLTLDFNGTSVKWYYAWLKPFGARSGGSRATWTVDNQNEETIVIPDVDPRFYLGRNNTYLAGLLFKTREVPPGAHQLKVTYFSGVNTARPLSLEALHVQNPNNFTSSVVPSGNPSSDVPVNRAPLPFHRCKIYHFLYYHPLSNGAVIAIAVDLAAAVFFAALGWFFYRRWRRQKHDTSSKLADSSNPIEIIVQASSPNLIYYGRWTSSPPPADLWNSTAFSSYPFSDWLYMLQPGENTGSVLYNNAVAPAGARASSSLLNCTLKTVPSAIHRVPSESAKGTGNTIKVAVGAGIAAAAVITVVSLVLYRSRHCQRLDRHAHVSQIKHTIAPYAQAPIIPTPFYKYSTVTPTKPFSCTTRREHLEDPPPYTRGAHPD